MLPLHWQTPWFFQGGHGEQYRGFSANSANYWPIFNYFERNIPSGSDGGTFIQAGTFIQHYTVPRNHLVPRGFEPATSAIAPIHWAYLGVQCFGKTLGNTLHCTALLHRRGELVPCPRLVVQTHKNLDGFWVFTNNILVFLTSAIAQTLKMMGNFNNHRNFSLVAHFAVWFLCKVWK